MTIVPRRQSSKYVSHCVHIEAGVFDEGHPLIGVRLPRCAPGLPVRRTRLRQQVYQLLPRLVFSFVLRHVQHAAELAQRAGQAVLQGQHHRIDDLLHGDVDAPLAQHRAVEGAVVDHDALGRVDDVLQRGTPERQVLRVPDRNRLVVPRPRDQHHLGVLCIAVRAVGYLGFAVGLKVEVEGVHPRLPWRISLTRPMLMLCASARA
jgi:hypothetical protein